MDVDSRTRTRRSSSRGTQSLPKGQGEPAKWAIGKTTRNRKLEAKGTVWALKGKAQDKSGRADRKPRRGANSL